MSKVLMCTEGAHEWVRVGPGRPPKNCPEHATREQRQAAERHRALYVPSARKKRVRPSKPPISPEERSARTRAAALAKWSRASEVERAEWGRAASQARWRKFYTDSPPLTREQSDLLRAARFLRREALRRAPCLICGTPVGNAKRVICPADQCRLRYNSQRMSKIIHARRAAKRGAESEVFDPREVFERDGWTCGICADPVDRTVRWPDPGAPTLDHIVPLSKGGAHSRANTQLAHFYCNNVKGARPYVA